MNFRYFGLAYAQDVNQDAESYSAAAGDVTRIIGGNVTTVEKYPFAVQVCIMTTSLSVGI